MKVTMPPAITPMFPRLLRFGASYGRNSVWKDMSTMSSVDRFRASVSTLAVSRARVRRGGVSPPLT